MAFNITQYSDLVSEMTEQQCHAEVVTNSQVQFLTNVSTILGLFCAKTYDGVLCWDETPAGAVAYQSCPANVNGWSTKLFAYKICEEDGTWYRHPDTQEPWTNYNSCVNVWDYYFRNFLIWLNAAGYGVTFVAVTLSACIFHVLRLVYCVRTKVHAHLFTAHAFNSVSWILWYVFIVRDVDLLQDNPIWCQIATWINTYFMMSTYMWTFCEGFNLHVSLMVVFANRVCTMKLLILLGWVLPLLMTSLYGTYRLQLGDTDRCMIDESQAHYVLTVPIGITFFLSLYFLVRVVMIMTHQYNAAHQRSLSITPNRRLEIAKMFKAVVISVNLTGVYYAFLPVHPPLDTTWDMIYAVLVSLLTSLQGFVASIVFCFNNGEVMTQFSQELARRRRLQQDLAQINSRTTVAIEMIQELAEHV